mmetsp:Transcript_32557/g.73562  ORF Transcript_32557/g.73562 Transcript_32557/m.73562 type:complete len:264 (-) Transcript_32557:380-1171(-)
MVAVSGPKGLHWHRRCSRESPRRGCISAKSTPASVPGGNVSSMRRAKPKCPNATACQSTEWPEPSSMLPSQAPLRMRLAMVDSSPTCTARQSSGGPWRAQRRPLASRTSSEQLVFIYRVPPPPRGVIDCGAATGCGAAVGCGAATGCSAATGSNAGDIGELPPAAAAVAGIATAAAAAAWAAALAADAAAAAAQSAARPSELGPREERLPESSAGVTKSKVGMEAGGSSKRPRFWAKGMLCGSWRSRGRRSGHCSEGGCCCSS